MGIGVGLFLVLIAVGIEVDFIAYLGLIVVIGSALLEAIFYRCQTVMSLLVSEEKKQTIVHDVAIN